MLKANDRLYADKTLLVIGPNGEQLGQMRLGPACLAAQEAKLDLVLVAETSVPPVCRIMDYGKLCYEQKKKLKEVTEILRRNNVKYSLAFCKKDKEFHYLLRIFNTDPGLLDLVELVISV